MPPSSKRHMNRVPSPRPEARKSNPHSGMASKDSRLCTRGHATATLAGAQEKDSRPGKAKGAAYVRGGGYDTTVEKSHEKGRPRQLWWLCTRHTRHCENLAR